MSRIKTWEISDEFWTLVEPLVPTSLRDNDKEYKRKPGGGTKPKYSNRVYFSAVVYILRTGIQWNAIPREKFDGLAPPRSMTNSKNGQKPASSLSCGGVAWSSMTS